MLRPIKIEDIGLLIENLLTLAAESPRYGKTTVDEPYVRATLKLMIESSAFIGCIDTDLRGFMFGQASRQWFDPDLNAHEQLLYILPEYRGGMLAVRLIKEFEALAYARDCIHVRAGVSTLMSNTEQVLRLYERLGYTRDGMGVSKRIK